MADQSHAEGYKPRLKYKDLGDDTFAISVYDHSPDTGSGDLDAATPDDHTVTTSSTEAVAANTNRTGLVVMNIGAQKVSLGLDGNPAVLNKGITLNPGGSTWVMDSYTFTTGAIAAIADTGGSTLSIQEFS